MKKRVAMNVGAMVLCAVLFFACGSSSSDNDSGPSASGSATNPSGKSSKTATNMIIEGVFGGLNGTIGGATKGVAEKGTAQIIQSRSQSFSCTSGSGTTSTSVSGHVGYNDNTGEIESLDLSFSIKEELNECAEADDQDTADFDESKLTVGGSMIADVRMEYPINGKIALSAKITGDVNMGGSVCPEEGMLTMDITCNAEAIAPEGDKDPDFSGAMSGTIKGNICGEEVDCSLSGDCDNPQFTGTGC